VSTAMRKSRWGNEFDFNYAKKKKTLKKLLVVHQDSEIEVG